MVRPGREMANDLKRFKHRFFNVKTEPKVKGGEAKAKEKAEAMPEQPAEPTAAELRAEQRAAMKPVSKGFVRISPKAPRLK